MLGEPPLPGGSPQRGGGVHLNPVVALWKPFFRAAGCHLTICCVVQHVLQGVGITAYKCVWAAMVVNCGPPFLCAIVGAIFFTAGGGGGGCPITISSIRVGEVMVMKHLWYGSAAQNSRRGQKGGCIAKSHKKPHAAPTNIFQESRRSVQEVVLILVKR